jgi:hypothetical protein
VTRAYEPARRVPPSSIFNQPVSKRLQRVLRGRLAYTPRAGGDGYDFGGSTRFDRLFTGVVLLLAGAPEGATGAPRISIRRTRPRATTGAPTGAGGEREEWKGVGTLEGLAPFSIRGLTLLA